MSHKPIIKVSFNEDAREESIYFLQRLIEKIIIDQLDLTPHMKGTLLINNQENRQE